MKFNKEKMNKEKAIVLFNQKTIRRTWHHEEWWFAITDIIHALTDTEGILRLLQCLARK